MLNHKPFGTFITDVKQRPMPTGRMERMDTMARELAEGISEGYWEAKFTLREVYRTEDEQTFRLYVEDDRVNVETSAYLSGSGLINIPSSHEMREYFFHRWSYPREVSKLPEFKLLLANNYIVSNPMTMRETDYVIRPSCFELLRNVPPATSFISYRRRESSAFALLVLARLKAQGIQAFVDMSIEAGADWEQTIREQIDRCDVFVMLIAPDTFNSPVIVRELQYAIQKGRTIIPVSHNGFDFYQHVSELPEDLRNFLTTKNAIRVVEESAREYNAAVEELLNRFGVTPT